MKQEEKQNHISKPVGISETSVRFNQNWHHVPFSLLDLIGHDDIKLHAVTWYIIAVCMSVLRASIYLYVCVCVCVSVDCLWVCMYVFVYIQVITARYDTIQCLCIQTNLPVSIVGKCGRRHPIVEETQTRDTTVAIVSCASRHNYSDQSLWTQSQVTAEQTKGHYWRW
jgi:hypothetical protein